MTNQQSPQPENHSSNDIDRVGNVMGLTRTKIIIGGGVVAIALGGYLGIKYLVTEVMPATVEKELAKALDREIVVGEVSSFGLSHIVIDNVEMPPTDEDNSFVEIKNIKTEFNLLGIIFNNQLPINITVEKITGFGQLDTLITSFTEEEEEDEIEIPDTLKLPELPVVADISLTVEKTTLAITPNNQTQAIEIDSNINLHLFYDNENQPLNYDIKAQIENNPINLEGEIRLVTTAAQSKIQIQNLDLISLSQLIPEIPLTLNQGKLSTNLELTTSSLNDWSQLQGNGSLAITNIEGVTNLVIPNTTVNNIQRQTFSSNAFITVNEQIINIQEINGNLGDIAGRLSGEIDFNRGYSLQGNIDSINIKQILTSLAISSPINLDGIASGNLIITGEIDNPQITSNLEIDNTIVDQLNLGTTIITLESNLDETRLDKFTVTPEIGGEIVATGLITTNLREKIENQVTIDINSFPLQIDFNADLPTQELIEVYNIIPPEIKVNQLQARGNFTGSINNLEGLINFNLPPSNIPSSSEIDGKGELTLKDNRINLHDTQLTVNNGTIALAGETNLTTKNWDADLVITSVALTPFFTQYCVRMGNCPANLNTAIPIIAQQGNVKVRGNFDNLDLDNLSATSDIRLTIDRGNAILSSSLDNGRVIANAQAQEISLNQIVDNLPVNSTIINSDIQLTAEVEELLTLGERNLNTLNLRFTSELGVNGGLVNVSSNVDAQNTTLLANLVAVDLTNINPALGLQVQESRFDLSVNTPELINTPINFADDNFLASLPSLRVDGDSRIALAQGFVNANTRINNQQTTIVSNFSGINLNTLTNDSVRGEIARGDLDFLANTGELWNAVRQPLAIATVGEINSLRVDSNLNTIFADGNIDSQTTIANGLVTVRANAQNLEAQQILTNFPLDATAIDSRVNLNVSLGEILTATTNYFNNETISALNSLNLNAVTNFNLAQGRGELTTGINNNRWQGILNTEEINIDNLAQQLSITLDNQLLADSPLNTSINVQGSFASLLEANPSTAIEVNSALLQWGDNQVTASGRLSLVNLLTNPDITNLALNIESQTDLATIPANEILAQIPQQEGIRLLPEELNLQGIANLVGSLRGQNLLTNPLGEDNFLWDGDVRVSNLILNDIEFESLLTGNLNVNLSRRIVLDLRGDNDVIYANFIPNNITPQDSDSYIAFIPDEFTIRQVGTPGFLAEGRREGQELTARVSDFTLESLNIAPGVNFGVLGNLQGRVEQEVTVNLEDFSSRGSFTFTEFGIGNILAQEVSATFVLADNIAELRDASLRFGDTVYALEGRYNLATQEIQARLNLDGDVRDIFDTLQISDVETLTSIVQQIQRRDIFASADSIETISVGSEDATIANQIILLNSIDNQIKSFARQIERGGIPTNLEIAGRYEGEIVVGGRLTNPRVRVDFEGSGWEWLPRESFPNVVDGLGLIIQQNQPVIIPKIALSANFQDGNLGIEPLAITVNDSELYFAGNLSLRSQEGEFRVTNLSLDTFSQFLPESDFGGRVDVEGRLAGNFANPVMRGSLSLRDSSFDGAILTDEIRGDFVYENYILNFVSTAPDEIQITMALPYHPLFATPFPAKINLVLAKEALQVLGVLTQGQLQFSGGEADANIDVEIASLNRFLENPSLESVQINGRVNLEDAKLDSISLDESVFVSGEIDVDRSAIALNQVQAKINDTEVNIGGRLPLITAQPDNETPLKIDIAPQNLNIPNLYRGGVNADVTIEGTLLNPLIGGFLQLDGGNISIPNPNQNGQQPLTAEEINIASQWLGEDSDNLPSLFEPQLNNFQVRLRDLDFSQWGIYRFLFDGDLTVNGRGLNPENIRANGEINLRRGRITLGSGTPFNPLTSPLAEQTTLFLSRTNQNRIIFREEQGILNPEVDILVEGDFADYSRQLSTSQRNEILDPLVRGGRGETIRVELAINGNLQSITPLLLGSETASTTSCTIATNEPVIKQQGWTEEEFNQVARCSNVAVLSPEGSNFEILNSPFVSLSSIPQRSQGELVNLIVGGQFLGLINQLENAQGQDLLESGVLQFVLVPILNELTFGVNERVSSWGQPLGMKDLRVFPLVEGVYPLRERSNISVSYDYIYNEFKVRYQRRF